jgi:ATP-dependent helicase IRC3
VLTADDLKTAIKSCDTYVEKKVMQGPLAKGCARAASFLILLTERPARLRRTAAWRMQPATDAQKALIRTRWKVPNAENAHPFDGSDDKREKISNMKKGEAANILTRLRHGAQVRTFNPTIFPLPYTLFQARYEQRLKSTKKVADKAAKEAMRKAREHVQVGPLVA